jgi:hypothetical protein
MQCSQKDMFAAPTDHGPLRLELRGLAMPANRSRKDQVRKTTRKMAPNCHVPNFKNCKMLLTKAPGGRPLKKPFLITKPEFQQWMAKAVQRLESQLLSMCRVEGGTRLDPSKLFAILSRLPVDDSWRDYPEGSWKVMECPPGEEGVSIVIEKLR